MLVAIPPFAQNIEVAWEDSRCRRMLTAFGSFSRFVHFDKRGTGMSDPSVEVASIWVDMSVITRPPMDYWASLPSTSGMTLEWLG